MKKHFLFGILCLSLSQVAASESGLPNIKEGMWELSFKSNTAAMPTPMPSITYTVKKCLTPKTAADPHTLLETNDCEISDLNQQTEFVTWNMRCQQQNSEMLGSGKINFQAESFIAILNMTLPASSAGAMTTATQINGRYLGVCQ